ncbi:ComEC/Rec2 family competence protein [Mycoplasma leachii]
MKNIKIFMIDFYNFLILKHYFLLFLLLSICMSVNFILTLSPNYLILAIFFLSLTIILNYKNILKILLIFISINLVFLVYMFWFKQTDLTYLNNKTITSSVIDKKTNYAILIYKNIKFYINDYNNKFLLDQIIEISGVFNKLESNTSFYQFDFFNYLNKQFIIFEMINYKVEKISNGIRSNFFLTNYFYTNKLASMFLFESIDKSTKFGELIKDLNLGFLIVISSYNIHFFTKFFYKLNTKFKWTAIITYLFYLIVFLLSYLANFSYASLRIVIFFIISLYFKITRKPTSLIFKRFLTLLICFVLTPSFLTSNSVIFVIISFMFYYEKIFRNNFLDLLLRSLLFTFYFIPLQIFYFYSFSVVIQSLLIILRPLFSFLYFSIFIWIWFDHNFLTNILIKIFEFIKKININFNIGYVNVIFLILAYLSILIIIKYNFKSIWSWISLIFILLLSYLISWLIKPSVFLVMLNVGNGNCFIFHDKFKNTTIINDCGVGKGFSKNIGYEFLKYFGINHVDLIIISHNHADHYNAIDAIKKNIKVYETITYNNFLPFKSIKNVNMHFFWNNLENENDKSLVYLFEYRNIRILFTGDVEKEAEKLLVDNDYFKYVINLKPIDILQVPHHGSNTSSTDQFISLIKPKYGLISGNKRTYNFPRIQTLETLYKHNVKYFISQINGNAFYNFLTNSFWFKK